MYHMFRERNTEPLVGFNVFQGLSLMEMRERRIYFAERRISLLDQRDKIWREVQRLKGNMIEAVGRLSYVLATVPGSNREKRQSIKAKMKKVGCDYNAKIEREEFRLLLKNNELSIIKGYFDELNWRLEGPRL